jgi:pSer/pThr/pTyr-binding forkhead associated (FHA) protein
MARLVVLSEGLTGKTHELKVDKTTIGRVEDNAFQIPEPSVSSHHCEIILRGAEVVVKDLGSTNGTFINGQQVTGESVLKPSQILRLGNVEIRLEDETKAPPPKKLPDQTMVIPQGVKLGPETATGTKAVALDKTSGFAKKSNKGTKVFIAIAAVALVVIIAYIVVSIGGGANR